MHVATLQADQIGPSAVSIAHSDETSQCTSKCQRPECGNSCLHGSWAVELVLAAATDLCRQFRQLAASSAVAYLLLKRRQDLCKLRISVPNYITFNSAINAACIVGCGWLVGFANAPAHAHMPSFQSLSSSSAYHSCEGLRFCSEVGSRGLLLEQAGLYRL